MPATPTKYQMHDFLFLGEFLFIPGNTDATCLEQLKSSGDLDTGSLYGATLQAFYQCSSIFPVLLCIICSFHSFLFYLIVVHFILFHFVDFYLLDFWSDYI